MKRSLLLLVSVLTILALLVTGCGGGTTNKPEQKPDQGTAQKEGPKASGEEKYTPEIIRIGAAAMGGNYFVAGGSLASTLTKQAKLQTAVLVTGGGRNNAILANDGKIEFGFSNTVELSEEWTKNNKQSMRSVMPGFSGELHIVVKADSKFKDVTDLKDAVVSVGAAGSTHAVAADLMFAALGFTPKKIVNANLEDTANLMMDGQVDAMMVFSSPPVSSIAALATTNPIRLLSVTDDQINKFLAAVPAFTKQNIPANSYKNQTGEVQTVSSWNILIANKNVSDDVVYNVVSTSFKNKDLLVTAMKGWVGLDTANVEGMYIPIHPGAIKYYKEQGLSIPDRLVPPESKK